MVPSAIVSPRGLPADSERQGRPQGAPRADAGTPDGRGGRRAAHAARATAGGDLGARARHQPDRRHRQLLRPRPRRRSSRRSSFAEIEHELGGALPLGAIFRAPTIETLAELIESGESGSRWTSLVPIQSHGHTPAGLLRARRRRNDSPPRAARALPRRRPAALRAASSGPVRRSAAAPNRRGDGVALPRGDPPGATETARTHSPATASARSSHSRWRSACSPRARRCVWSRPFNGPSPPGSGGGAGSAISPRSVAARAQTPLSFRQKVRRALREPFRIRRAFLFRADSLYQAGRRRRTDLRVRVAARARPALAGTAPREVLPAHPQRRRTCLRAPAVSGRDPRLVRRTAVRGSGARLGRTSLSAASRRLRCPATHTNNRQVMTAATRGVRARPAAGVPRRVVNRSLSAARRAPDELKHVSTGTCAIAFRDPSITSCAAGTTTDARSAGRNPGRGRLLPDFLIIGTAKSGTTTLHGWLSEHPFVEPAVKKEVHFFDYDYYRGVDWYRSHFPDRAGPRQPSSGSTGDRFSRVRQARPTSRTSGRRHESRRCSRTRS